MCTAPINSIASRSRHEFQSAPVALSRMRDKKGESGELWTPFPISLWFLVSLDASWASHTDSSAIRKEKSRYLLYLR